MSYLSTPVIWNLYGGAHRAVTYLPLLARMAASGETTPLLRAPSD
ncbi:MAG: hypothetical protein ABL932_24945 [Terricaulis sp.]